MGEKRIEITTHQNQRIQVRDIREGIYDRMESSQSTAADGIVRVKQAQDTRNIR